MPAEDRRAKTRTARSGTQNIYLTYLARPNYEQTLTCKLTDVNEDGCGLKVEMLLSQGTPVKLMGDFRTSGRDIAIEGRVAWARQIQGSKLSLIGIAFGRSLSQAEAGAAARESPPPPKAERAALSEDKPDHYEALQLSSNADADTIHRVYRALAQRFHPDNKETGSTDMFRRVLDAYQVLSDPERRAAYDADYRVIKKLQWRIFDQPKASVGVEGEKAKRRGVLSLLYTKRRNVPESPAMSLVELEEILGVPRDHLEFTLWYLRENALVTRGDNAKFAITCKGVDLAEEQGSWQITNDRMIESHEAIERRNAFG
jgi:hypothetical protein